MKPLTSNVGNPATSIRVGSCVFMSRIEKGTQRFRPTVVARRVSTADHGVGGSVSSRPVVAVPTGSSSTTTAPSSSNTQKSAKTSSTGTAALAPIVPTRIVPRARNSSGLSSEADASVASSAGAARSYAFASQPTKVRIPVQPRASTLTPSVSETASSSVLLPNDRTQETNVMQPHLSPYERFLHAAQADPQGVLHMESHADPSAIAEQAAETWQCLDPGVRAEYGATNVPAHTPPRLTPRSRAPRKRTGTTISDDEAEYKRQCAQQEGETNVDGTGLPPLRVDIGTTRMESIAVTNWKSGRASSRTFELERVRARQLKKRRSEAQFQKEEADIKQSSTPVPSTPRETPAPLDEPSALQTADTEPRFNENRFAVQTRIVDGKIVLDEQSLYANYRDDEQQEREQRHWEVIDEHEGDQFVNSASRSKQRHTQRWTHDETERFFQAISQWGTDFEMITRLFPRRTRREIKAKWTKESRQNPSRLDAAFQRRVAVDLHAYGQAAGVDLSGPPPVITPRAEPKVDVQEEHQVEEIVSEPTVQ